MFTVYKVFKRRVARFCGRRMFTYEELIPADGTCCATAVSVLVIGLSAYLLASDVSYFMFLYKYACGSPLA